MLDNSDAETLVSRIVANACDEDELVGLLEHVSLLVRTNAMMALSRLQLRKPDEVVASIYRVASAPTGHVKVLGRLTQEMFAGLVLREIGTDIAIRTLQRLMASWSDQTRSDFEWHCKNNPIP